MVFANTRRFRCLAVRPAQAPGAQGGDEVIYRKSIPYLARFMDVETLELQPVGKFSKILNILKGNPPETTRFMSRANADAVTQKLQSGQFDIVFLFNEVSFSLLPRVKAFNIPAILVAQNVHSLVAATDPSRIARLLRPLALAFERRWYDDSYAGLVLISQADLMGLRQAGITRLDVTIAPAGPPPAVPLSAHAPVLHEAVLTGSYGWWRKRRDLKSFLAGSPLGLPIYAADPLALEILGNEGRPLEEASNWSWQSGLRFGLVTDAFLGGFKLKSLEYVAQNCVVLSLSDIRPEFEGLPYAEEFVLSLRSKTEVADAISAMIAKPPGELVARFIEFKSACLERYNWENCLKPLYDIANDQLDGQLTTASDSDMETAR
jgi:hypothetical protein